MQITLLNINATKHKGREIADQSNTVSLSFINLLGQQMQISTRKRKSSNIMLAGHCILLFVYIYYLAVSLCRIIDPHNHFPHLPLGVCFKHFWQIG